MLAAKLVLLREINLNWDEFYFLTHVHSLARGELPFGLQTAYAQLFRWLPGIGGDEIAQLTLARGVMWPLLAVGAAQLYRLARRWFEPSAAALAVLSFLASWTTLRHGAAFRADSMLLPLQLAALLALTHPTHAPRRRALQAGAWLGLATALTLKAALLAPVVLALLALRASGAEPGVARAARGPVGSPIRHLVAQCAWLALAASLVAGLALALHFAALDATAGGATPAATGPATAAGSAWQRTVANAEFAPTAEAWRRLAAVDLAWWLASLGGAAWCVVTRRWSALACALALTPLLYYRNAFAYYYVPMCAPASVLLAAAWEALAAGLRRLAPTRTVELTLGGLAVAVAASALLRANAQHEPRQQAQRAVVAAVHEIFPDPVPYLDHSGMIASFRKANFFMSSWGIAEYRAAGRPFVAGAFARHAPPLLLANRGAIVPHSTAAADELLAQDRESIERSYVPYWGPVYVAGTTGVLSAGETRTLSLPFAGRYRLEAPAAIELSGRRVEPGEVVHVDAGQLRLPARQLAPEAAGLGVRLVWAAARPAPDSPPPRGRIYDALTPID